MKEISRLKSHPAVKVIIEGNVFPKTFSSLNKKRRVYYSKNFGGELAWLVWSLKKYNKKINEFVTLKEQLEQYLLLSEYEGAIQTLDKIESICYSYWSTECRFSILESKDGTERNWELLNDLTQKANKDDLILFHLQLFSKKAESKLSYNRYRRVLSYDLSNLELDLKEYLHFKFGYFFLEGYSHYEYFLLTESNTSIIDRYELVINLLTEIIVDKSHSQYDLCLNVVKELAQLIDDKRLHRLLEYTGEKEICENAIPPVLDYLGDYTKGCYDKCISDFPNLIRKFPNYIELYEPYIKSLIETDSVFQGTGVSKEIDDILANLYSLYNFGNDFDFAFENLAKKIITFSGLTSFRQLLGLISSLKLIKSKNGKVTNLFFFNSNFSNPIIFLMNEIRPSQKGYSFNSLPYKINYQKGLGEFDKNEYKDIIPDKKRDLYEIRSTYLNDNLEDCLNLLNKYSKREDLKIIDKSDTFNLTYSSFLNKDEINNVVSLLTNQFLINPNLCAKVDTMKLLNIVDADIETIPGSYEAVIFSNFANSNSYFQFVSLDELFIEIGVEYPHQLFNFINDSNKNKIIYILEKVCNVDVLGNFLIYESKDEVVKERERILMELLDILPEKEDEYIDEIAKLKRLEIVKSVIKEVNDGRIYINVNSLDQSQKTSFQNNFERLQSIIEYTSTNDLYFIDVNDRIQKLYQGIPNLEDLKKDAAFLTCKSFVNELTNNFLYSEEYGLEGCLSTRIRHGALENIIRSVFERNGLIAKKIGEDYQNVEYWIIDGNHLNEKKHLKIQESFKVFSEKTDDLIKFLINNVLQIYSIKSTENEKAIFNYYFSDDVHWIIYKDLKDIKNATYDDFINSIFDVLKIHTDTLLEKARKYFKEEVKNTLINYLEELNNSINNALDTDAYPKLTNNINIAITEIQNELEENVSEWFKLSEDTYQNILDFESIINTSISLTNNNNIDFNPKVDCNSNLGIYGYLHFIFIFRILFDNIIKHSKLSPKDADASVNVNYNEKERILKLVVKNKLSDEVNIDGLEEKFVKIKDEWETKPPSQSVINTEGGSGYEKIKRILNYDLKSRKNKIDYSVQNNYLEVVIDIPIGTLIN